MNDLSEFFQMHEVTQNILMGRDEQVYDSKTMRLVDLEGDWEPEDRRSIDVGPVHAESAAHDYDGDDPSGEEPDLAHVVSLAEERIDDEDDVPFPIIEELDELISAILFWAGELKNIKGERFGSRKSMSDFILGVVDSGHGIAQQASAVHQHFMKYRNDPSHKELEDL